jgi:hypothetical protein
MTFATTIVFYLTFGAGVAAALLLRRAERQANRQIFRAAVAVLFWPLFIPLLLERTEENPSRPECPSARASDSLARAIAQVECELDAALGSLDGWAEGVLVDERQRLAELRAAWRSQAERVRELDRFLAQPDALSTAKERSPLDGLGASTNERRQKSEQGRLANMRRLRALRQRMLEDLLATLAWVRELATMIHLAKFSGAPASRAEELVSQIAAAVEGLNEASNWSAALPGDGLPGISATESRPALREPADRASSNPPVLDRASLQPALQPSDGSS